MVAADAIRGWMYLAKAAGADLTFCRHVEAFALEVEDWQKRNHKKVPDCPAEILNPPELRKGVVSATGISKEKRAPLVLLKRAQSIMGELMDALAEQQRAK